MAAESGTSSTVPSTGASPLVRVGSKNVVESGGRHGVAVIAAGAQFSNKDRVRADVEPWTGHGFQAVAGIRQVRRQRRGTGTLGTELPDAPTARATRPTQNLLDSALAALRHYPVV